MYLLSHFYTLRTHKPSKVASFLFFALNVPLPIAKTDDTVFRLLLVTASACMGSELCMSCAILTASGARTTSSDKDCDGGYDLFR